MESIERIIRQLEAMGENLEQSGVEIIIENKLSAYQQRKNKNMVSSKLRQFLAKLIQRNEEVTRSQFDIIKQQKELESTALCYTKYSDRIQSVEPTKEETNSIKWCQATYITKELTKRLNLEDIGYEQMEFATSGNSNPQLSILTKVRIGIKTIEAEIYLLQLQ
ncbi:Zinc knuckle family protein [Dirofilaria immitis]|nr:Zinc knuckle family protein [Dirofilaria immitis]